MALCANTSIRCRFAFPFFWYYALRWVLISCVDSVFFPEDSSHGIHYHFIHMVAWGHQVHIRGSSAVSFISAFGLSEPCSAMPSLSFRLSACPSCVRLCRVCLFGFRLVYRDMFSPSPANGRRFDQLSPLSNPTQSPALAFMGFSLDLVRSKGRYIFGQGTLFWICAFISVFSKMWAY